MVEARNRQAEQLALIVETQQAIATATGGFDDVMAVIAERALLLTAAAAAVVEVPQGDEMVYVAVAGAAQGTEGLRLSRSESLSGLCVSEERTLVSEDTENDPRVDREACRKVGARSMLVVPLRGATAEGAAAIKVYSPFPGAFHDQDAYALELMAELTAATIQRHDEVARLTELDRLRDELIGVVTHELRTPVTSIAGFTRMALEDPERLDPEVLSFLRVVERNAERLAQLVDDLLLLLREDSDHSELQLREVDLAALVEESVTAVRPVAERGRIELTVALERPLVARVDETRISQVVDNLLSNAVKYTPAGGTVHVALRGADGAVEIEVADTGIGIPEDEQQQLFQRFFRATSATDRGITGTGLGLTIVKTLVEAHGGTVSCESSSGEGTTFRVRLPT